MYEESYIAYQELEDGRVEISCKHSFDSDLRFIADDMASYIPVTLIHDKYNRTCTIKETGETYSLDVIAEKLYKLSLINWKNDGFDELLDRFNTTNDPQEAESLYKRIIKCL